MQPFPFRIPEPEGVPGPITWKEGGFTVDGAVMPVLEYSENFAGWDDDLTALHEEGGANHPIDRASRNRALAAIRRYTPREDAVILEIGCSSGYLLDDMSSAFPRARLIGADVVKSPLLRLAEKRPDIPLLRFDLLQCPLPEQCVDVIVMLNVLEHIEDDVGAMRQAYRLLRPGGIIVLEVPAGPSLYDAYDEELRHFRRYGRGELSRKLASQDFDVLESSHIGFLVFPAFALSKMKNRYTHSSSQSVVRDSIQKTQKSPALKLMMTLEESLSGYLSFPFGIRSTSVGRR